MKLKRNCGTCKWATFEMTKHKPPRFSKDAVSQCSWPMPEMIPLPHSITKAYGFRSSYFRNSVVPNQWEDCPTWTPKQQ
jgi:hypothetical protein